MRALTILVTLAAASTLSAQNNRVTALAGSKDSLHDLSDSIEALSHNVGKAVVQIFSTGYALPSDDEDDTTNASTTGLVTKQRSSGSGIIVSSDGYIITNNHVVRNARRVRVQLVSPPDAAPADSSDATLHAHGQLLEAHVIGVDREADLAVLKVDAPAPLPTVRLANSDALRQGQVVLAFGNPLGLENSVSLGIVSSLARQIKPDDPLVYIQTDAPINPGNSGGPLLNDSGEVVGINTFILTQSGGSEGIGFAIPSNVVRNVYDQIRRDGHVHRGEIGVTVQSITPELAAGLNLKQDTGAIISDVTPEGPADKAGIIPGDIILTFNTKPIRNAREFIIGLNNIRLDDEAQVTVLRGDDKLEMKVKVAERDDDPFRFIDLVKPEDNLVGKLGIVGVPITAAIAKLLPDTRKPYGVIVAARSGDSDYAGQGGLKLGDIIYSVNTTPVSTLDSLRNAVGSLKVTDPLVLQIERNGKLVYLTLSEE